MSKDEALAATRAVNHLTVPVSQEWQDQADFIAAFLTNRHDIEQALLTCATVPDRRLIERATQCIRASARRIPLQAEDRTRAAACLRAITAADTHISQYSIAVTAALLYLTPPEIGPLRADCLNSWMAEILAAALSVFPGALLNVNDGEDELNSAMRWCMEFASSVETAYRQKSLPGGEEAWISHWLPLFAYQVTALPFYAGYAQLKPLVAQFGRYRAEMFRLLAQATAPQPLRVIGAIPKRDPGDKRWRIALLCSHPGGAGHGLPHFIWWITCMDRARFEPVLVFYQYAENAIDIEYFVQQNEKILPSYTPIIVCGDGGLPELARFEFDALYNFDDLCRGRSEFPAYQRLAKKHFTAFYTPATTGCPEMDYFITSPDLDAGTPDAFTEHPLMSQGLPFCYHYKSYFGVGPLRDWRDEDIPADAIIYTIGSSMLLKLRPVFVDALLEILRRVPNAMVLALPTTRQKDRVCMVEMLQRRAIEGGIAPERIRLSVVANRPLLHGMLKVSDVFLDFFPFSGTNNLMDPLVMATPCLTMAPPDGASRHRIGGAILRNLGLNELVVETVAEYIDLAVRLGTDAAYRAQIKARLGPQVVEDSPLCDGPAFVSRMENVIDAALRESLGAP